jgi:hypothetical protein
MAPGHNFIDDLSVDTAHCDAMRAECRKDICGRLDKITEKLAINTDLTIKIDKDQAAHLSYHEGQKAYRWVVPILLSVLGLAAGAAYLFGQHVGGP